MAVLFLSQPNFAEEKNIFR